MHSAELIAAVAVTAELCGRTFTPAAATVFCRDLEAYPEQAVLHALVRCRKEVRGVLTTHDVISRIDDGRPGAEEAWAMIPTREYESVVWTAEMAEAYGACGHLIGTDRVAARMAFKETYTRLVARARDTGTPTQWLASLGHDPEGRKRVLAEAIKSGRLCLEDARKADPLALPPPAPTEEEAKRRHANGDALEAAADILQRGPADSRAWARDLKTREQGGLPLTDSQRIAWRRALHEGPSGELPGDFTPVPADCLPPGMRGGK